MGGLQKEKGHQGLAKKGTIFRDNPAKPATLLDKTDEEHGT